MADRRTQPPRDERVSKKPDRSAEMIHELATDLPPKDIASIKAASDAYDATPKDHRDAGNRSGSQGVPARRRA